MMFKRQTNRRSIGRLTENLDGVDTYEVLYTPIRGEALSYVHIANAYRDYLVAEKNLTARPQTPSLAVDLYGSMDVKAAFLGIEYSKQQSLTTFAQAQEILDALTEKGAGALAVRYLGWSRDGLLNKSLPSKAKPLSNLGGAKGFEALKAYIGSGANALYPDVDFMQYRSGRDRDAVKTSFNEVSYHTERLRSVFSARLGLTPIRLLTPQNLAPAAQKYLASYKKTGAWRHLAVHARRSHLLEFLDEKRVSPLPFPRTGRKGAGGLPGRGTGYCARTGKRLRRAVCRADIQRADGMQRL